MNAFRMPLIKQKNDGFTLVEIIVVIVIIAVLAIIVIPNFTRWIDLSKERADLANVNLLNRNTQSYRLASEGADPFLDSNNSSADLMAVLENGKYISGYIEPLANGGVFQWNFDSESWEYYVEGQLVGDPVFNTFISKIVASPITYSTYLTKGTTWNPQQGNWTQYNPNSWNGYLEKILERGDVADNTRYPEYEGTNTIGYENPYSGKATVVNFNDWRTIQNNYPTKIPPAILITNQAEFDPTSTSTFLTSNASFLKGTMVIYKNRTSSTPNDQTVVYYVLEDGSKSEIRPISEILSNP